MPGFRSPNVAVPSSAAVVAVSPSSRVPFPFASRKTTHPPSAGSPACRSPSAFRSSNSVPVMPRDSPGSAVGSGTTVVVSPAVFIPSTLPARSVATLKNEYVRPASRVK